MTRPSTAPTTRGLIVRLVVFAVWIALLAVSIISGDPFRIAVSSIGLVATAATIALWIVLRRRAGAGEAGGTGEDTRDA